MMCCCAGWVRFRRRRNPLIRRSLLFLFLSFSPFVCCRGVYQVVVSSNRGVCVWNAHLARPGARRLLSPSQVNRAVLTYALGFLRFNWDQTGPKQSYVIPAWAALAAVRPQ
ncbi:hypothetical protein IWX49DRAFT_350622 [Phyllosticta citricarpa]